MPVKISVVIPTFNRRDSLARCLETLNAQDLAADQYEMVVVDDGSLDDTVEMLQSFQSRAQLRVVVQPENRGQTAALNAGTRAAVGDKVLFLDDDLLCDPNLLSAHLAAHAQCGGPVQVSGRMQTVHGTIQSLAEQSFHSDMERYYSALEMDPAFKFPNDAWTGPNCSLPRDILLNCGGYDERRFPWRGEDIDLGLRLWKAGVEFRYQPNAITWHRWVKSDQQSWSDFEHDGESMVALCRHHPEMRSHNTVADFANGAIWKRYTKIALTSLPSLLLSPLGLMAALLDRSPSDTRRGHLGIWCYNLRRNLAQLAGARREAGSWRSLQRLLAVRLAVLMYHHVGDADRKADDRSLTVSAENFEKHMRWLRRRGYTAITTSQWLASWGGGAPLPRKPIIITIDDAYADIARHALPILKRQNTSAVVFVITELSLSGATWERRPVMTVDQVQQWAAQGMEVGGHSRTHADLTKASDASLRDEVSGSYQDLTRAGLRPVAFAYPYGYFNNRVRMAVGENYQIAFTCEEGLNDLRTDPLLLRRTMVLPGDHFWDLELRARFGRNFLNDFAARVKLRTRLRLAMRRFSDWRSSRG